MSGAIEIGEVQFHGDLASVMVREGAGAPLHLSQRAKTGLITVVMLNASHMARRGSGGRTFASLDQALSHYRSPRAQALLRAARAALNEARTIENLAAQESAR